MEKLVLLLLVYYSSFASAQNLIPDAGFELITDRPAIWLNNREDFLSVSPHWFPATGNTPDIVSKNDKTTPFRKGTFGLQPAHSGEVMIGMQLAGERKDNDYFRRDYLSTRLNAEVVEGECYEISFWINHRVDARFLCDNIGLAISDTIISYASYKNLSLVPSFNYDQVITTSPNEWVEIRDTFEANTSGSFIIIGNFYDDLATEIVPAPNAPTSSQPVAYYYVDDISLRQVATCGDKAYEPFFTLPEVTFQLNSADISSSGRGRLAAFATELAEIPYNYELLVTGHTDSSGNEEHNKRLSLKRAFRVAEQLKINGIEVPVELIGKGSRQPIAANATEEGRALNRRVEISVRRVD